MNRNGKKVVTANERMLTLLLVLLLIFGKAQPVSAVNGMPHVADNVEEVADLFVEPNYISYGFIDNRSSLYANIPEDLLLSKEPISEMVWVNADALNVRSSTNYHSDVVNVLTRGQSATATERIEVTNMSTLQPEVWYHIQVGGADGYVLGEYLDDSPIAEYMGDFLITYYCPCAICCEIANRATASGVMPTEGRTIAADPSIPFGTKIMIDGIVYTVEDRGGQIKGNHIDIFVQDHDRCFKQPLGMQTVPVYHVL